MSARDEKSEDVLAGSVGNDVGPVNVVFLEGVEAGAALGGEDALEEGRVAGGWRLVQ